MNQNLNSRTSRAIASKSFQGPRGGTEHFITMTADSDLDLVGQIAEIEERYAAALDDLALADETAIFRRLFITDAMNQVRAVQASNLAKSTPENPVAVSLIQQSPLPGAKLALLAYHVSGDPTLRKHLLSQNDLLVEKKEFRHLWTTGLCAGMNASSTSSGLQTRSIFSNLISTLQSHRGTLANNCVRTWLYIKDVDVFYQGMVDARGDIFAEHGLNNETHYIASTGIEGACAHRYDLVAMDAYSNLDLDPRQVSYLNDFSRLCPTKNYSVHFERGTRIAYSDRAHHFISGTASIDANGQVVHVGNVLRQAQHALEHVAALLHSGGASLSDLGYVIVYLRDPTDYDGIRAFLTSEIPDVPTVIVQGAVCRPQWLVEIEGIAIESLDEPMLPSF